jgi:hypothetical protein
MLAGPSGLKVRYRLGASSGRSIAEPEPGARPIVTASVRDTRDQCEAGCRHEAAQNPFEEGMNLAHRQGDSLLGFFPREHAHFGLGREQRALHGDSVWMRGDLVRQHQDWVLAITHETAGHGEDEVGVGFEHVRLCQERCSGPVSASATTRPGLRVAQPAGDSLKLDVACKDLHLSWDGKKETAKTAESTMLDSPKRTLCLPTRLPSHFRTRTTLLPKSAS